MCRPFSASIPHFLSLKGCKSVFPFALFRLTNCLRALRNYFVGSERTMRLKHEYSSLRHVTPRVLPTCWCWCRQRIRYTSVFISDVLLVAQNLCLRRSGGTTASDWLSWVQTSSRARCLFFRCTWHMGSTQQQLNGVHHRLMELMFNVSEYLLSLP